MTSSSNAIFFALLSLVFAGFLDVVFKHYSLRQLSKGMFVFGMGMVWAVLQLSSSVYHQQSFSLDSYSLGYGLIAGALVAASNLLLIESLTRLDVSLGSTLYRLNTVGVVVFSFVFLLEPVTAVKLTGISFAVIAALLLYQQQHHQTRPGTLKTFFWVAALASLMRAGFGVITKAGLSNGADASTMMLLAAVCWILGGYGYALLRERRTYLSFEKVRYSVVAGILVFLIVNTLFAALARGDASVVVPIANLSFVIALAISVATGMERFNKRKGTALVCAGVAVYLLGQVP